MPPRNRTPNRDGAAGICRGDRKAPHPPTRMVVAADGEAICPVCGRVTRRSAAGDGVTKAEWPKP
ncbi:hypothetical protein G5B40_01305 [Pikeienuella piscinae]|uniref:Uncharacterized protein n=1 Tax=Pikeienuella piscinae TaxID=2748098 RepID=A0A7L5BUT6_9RHOB|nr:hypothetical protein [Pikeienuella piscinae]QIE54197.1 hypothetical protein G5B40_01305 [Pikeienuella piscinae]